MTVDPYLVPGTNILRNIPGFMDRSELARAEGNASALRILELEESAVLLRGKWDLDHLQAVHRHIFQDVYDWAGELRTVDMVKGEDFHPQPRVAYAQDIFDRLAVDNHVRGLDHATFVTKVSQYQSELFALHPFREGNM